MSLVGDDADVYFAGKLEGAAVLRDFSFLAALRALVAPRLEDGEKFTFSPIPINAKGDFALVRKKTNSLQLVYLTNGVGDKRSDLFDMLQEHVSGFGYSDVPKVAQYYKTAFQARAWSSEENRSAVIAVDSMDLRKLHILIASIPVVLPWYFQKKEDGSRFSQDEVELLMSVEKKDEKPFLAACAKLAKQFDMRECIIKHKLGSLSQRFFEVQLRQAEDQLSEKRSRIDDLYRRLEDALRERSDYITRIYGLKERLKERSGESDIADYFLCNSGMYLDGVVDTSFTFTASGYLENWDDDKAEAVIDNSDSFPYDIARDNGIDEGKFDKFLRAVFLDRSIRLRIYADYYLDIGGHIDAAHLDRHDPEIADYMPNPHIEEFECLGDYKRRILDCIHDGNTLEALSYCVASSRSLNWSDYTVMSKFFRYVCEDYRDMKCWELPDGSAVSVQEAIAWANEAEG